MLHIKIASTSNIQIALPAFLWSSQRNIKLSQQSNCCNNHATKHDEIVAMLIKMLQKFVEDGNMNGFLQNF